MYAAGSAARLGGGGSYINPWVGLASAGGELFISGFAAGAWATNCYVVATATGEPCLIIDPGQDSIDRVHEIIRENHLTPAAVLLTHGHMDHVWSVAPVERDFGIPAYIHRDDRYRLVEIGRAHV